MLDLYCSIFLLMVIVVITVVKCCFRAISAACSSAEPAQALAGLVLLLSVLYSGYGIPFPTMIGGLKWLSFLDVRNATVGLRTDIVLTAMTLSAFQIRIRGAHGQ